MTPSRAPIPSASGFLPAALRYGLATLVTGAALALQFFIIYEAKIAVPGILYPSCFLIAWWLGFGPALASIAIGMLGADMLFYEPRFSLKLLAHEDALRLAAFCATSGFAAWVVARGKKAEVNLVKSQALLQESEMLFRKVADDTPSLMWRSGTDRECDWFNRGWFEFTGRTLAQELGHGWIDGVHPEDGARCRSEGAEHFRRRQPFSMEYRLRRHDGQYRWILDRGAPRFSPRGEFLGFIGTCLDIHEQHEAVAALKELQLRFERSAAATDLGVWYCNLPFAELIWNSKSKEHFWLPADARVTIDVFYERIHPGDRERTRLAIEHSIRERAPYDIEYRTTNPRDESQTKVIRAIGWTDYDATGAAIRFDGITLDVTEAQMIARQRDESLEVIETVNRVGKSLSGELDLQKLVQSVTDAATQLSKAEFGSFFYNVTNEKGESYTLYTISGVSRDKFSGFPMPRKTAVFAPTFDGTGIVRSDDITRDPRYGQNAPRHGMPAGHLPVVSYLAVPVVSRSGEVIGGLFFGHSKAGVFTEREERIVTGLAAQAAIAMDNARLFEKANQAVRIRDEFLSISSHELRTPLTPLKMQLQGISRHLKRGTLTDLPEEHLQRMLESADRQVSRLTALIEDLLDVSRISSGKLTLNFETVDLTELVHEVVERYRPQLQIARCETRVQAAPSLVAQLDRLRFEQVLINFLTNAMRYAAGKPIDVTLAPEGDWAVLRVKDQGIGIPESDQQKIFNRFERGLSSANYGGLGLGLFIGQQIVNAHGGTISVTSQPGQGAEFKAAFPIRL